MYELTVAINDNGVGAKPPHLRSRLIARFFNTREPLQRFVDHKIAKADPLQSVIVTTPPKSLANCSDLITEQNQHILQLFTDKKSKILQYLGTLGETPNWDVGSETFAKAFSLPIATSLGILN